MNTITIPITPSMVADLYNPSTDGIMLLKGTLFDAIPSEQLKAWYETKRNTFEPKIEKMIKNHQEVSLVLNEPFFAAMNVDASRDAGLHQLYLAIRDKIAEYSNVPMKIGDRLETKLIHYPVSHLGVEAHRDLSSNINAIVIMNIYGTVNFYTASDKHRSDEKAYLIEPGDICIMRGPRTAAENDHRPIHYVLDVPEERLVFVCREINDETEQVINPNNWMGF